MLCELSIRNYALIESLRVEFTEGLNVLTGETGAGKSIIIDALSLILGEKASAQALKKGAAKCEVAGTFDLGGNKEAKKFLEAASLENSEDADQLFIRREVDAQGKSKAFVNDRPVGLAVLASLGDSLVDIHGQHDHQLLLKPAEQRDLLDRYGGHGALREQVAQSYGAWKGLAAEREAGQLSEQEKGQRIDLYRFQVQEIESARIAPGEEEEIEKLLPQLKHGEKLRVLADELFDQLYEAEGSAVERLRKAKKAADAILAYGVDLKDAPALLDEALVQAGEAARAAETFRDGLVSDPKKLDELIARQDQLDKLKRKYGGTLAAALEHFEKIRRELTQLEGHAEALQELESKIAEARAQLLRQGKKLGASRKKCGETLSAAAEKELKDLGFHKARFEVRLTAEKDEAGREAPSPTGLERAEFLFSANPGEDPKPLKSVISGGELSRVMLALKKILAKMDRVPTVIFDEIDNGIGGTMGNVIGEKLKGLSRSHQVLLITHLPQIAAFADRHFSIRKSVAGQKTQVSVEAVREEKRVKEIARMLGGVAALGEEPTTASLRHASELLQHAE